MSNQAETVPDGDTKPKAHHNLRWIFISIIVGAILIALLVIQPWNLPVDPHDVLDKAYAATAQVSKYRASYSIISLGYEGERTDVEFISPECYHATSTKVYFTTELIVVDGERYIKGSATSADDIAHFVSYIISALDEHNSASLIESLNKLEKLPAETIEGTVCAHYNGKRETASLSEITIAGLDPTSPNYEITIKTIQQMQEMNQEIEFWIGKKDGCIRQIKRAYQGVQLSGNVTVMVTPTTTGALPGTAFIYKFYDFNEPIVIEPPLDSEGQLLPGWYRVE